MGNTDSSSARTSRRQRSKQALAQVTEDFRKSLRGEKLQGDESDVESTDSEEEDMESLRRIKDPKQRKLRKAANDARIQARLREMSDAQRQEYHEGKKRRKEFKELCRKVALAGG